ncbi:terpene synthase [Nocardia terpenica]|uniref:Terpene synthase n=1 Tax=Nocardia terpenica TaxID=455432 RepID=A0A291RPN2_9NOCA|nr:terpene synthase [Nocardia terpenica]
MCRTLAKVNPDYPTIYEHNAAWVRRFLPFPDATAMSLMLENRYPLWESLVYPSGLAGRVFHSSCITSLMFEVDDVAFLQGALFEGISEDWYADHPYGPAFTDIYGVLKQKMPAAVYRRYRQDWRDWFTATLEENKYRQRDEIPCIRTFLPLRRVSVGLRPYIVCIEYVLGLDLTELLALDRELRRAKLVAVEHAMLVNDLFSFRWESFHGDYSSIVAVLVFADGHTLQEAVDITCGRIREADIELGRLSDILRLRYAEQPLMQIYIDAINAFCAGNLRWSLETSRYNGHAQGWNGLRSGILTLYPDRTVIEPNESTPDGQ